MLVSSPKVRKLLTVLILTLLGLSAFVISGFTVASVDTQTNLDLPPNEGPVVGDINALPETGGGDDGQSAANGAAPEPVDVIKNGNFENPFEPDGGGVAPDWEPFSNGQAQFGWYEESWPEAVYKGEQAQLMEIFLVEANVLDRVIAIHQTVNVASNATYSLTIHALMRSQVQAADRNNHEFEMHWGVDFSGEGNYDNVKEWTLMPLEEQFRLGSTGKFPEDVPLFYELITGTISTGESTRISLFIRGLKKFSTGAEVNFDVDDVSLVGPPPGTIVVITPEAPAASPPQEEAKLPTSGAILPKNISIGALLLGGLVLVVLGTGAAANLLQHRKEP